MKKLDQLEKLRKEIDKIDSELIRVIAKRFKVTGKVKLLKIKNDLPREDKNREAQIMDVACKLAGKLNISGELVKNILRLIIKESKK